MPKERISGSRVTVIGAARSGMAAAKLLHRHGARTLVSEFGRISDDRRSVLRDTGIAFEEGGHSARVLEADFIVVSPGVPSDVPVIQQAVNARIPVYSEIEVASWFFEGAVLAITGSNGKTTTTSLIAHLLKYCGVEHVLAGNIGFPFSDFADSASSDTIVVLEVSSFQLDHIDTFCPTIGVLLNITPDHLDRYQNDFALYAASKARIFENMGPGNALIFNADDPEVQRQISKLPPEITPYGFSLEDTLKIGGYCEGESLMVRTANAVQKVAIKSVPLRGKHNRYNTLAALLAVTTLGVPWDRLVAGLVSFAGVVHRLEPVRTLGGVQYVNDSKATNVEAVWYALDSFQSPVLLIAGGRDKGNNYASLVPLVQDRVRAVIGIGESAEKVVTQLGTHAPYSINAGTLEQALQQARAIARPGDTVLLSPACASFDQFQNYEARGDAFRKLVNAL